MKLWSRLLLCYRCGSHVPDSSESCGTCGQKLSGGEVRQATGTFSHKRTGQGSISGSPYKAGETIAGRYLVKEVVGTGPLGFVLRAQDKETDAEVAVKVIHPRFLQTPEERDRFAQQIAAVRSITHSNLVHIFGDGEDQGWPFYAMQFVEGLTLRKIIDLHLEKGQVFSPREVEPILAQIASGLEAGSKVGPHGDLRPENVVVLPDLLKVSDFALALAIPRLPLIQALKSRNADRYLAPEFVSGAEVDARADVYAMGMILGEMLSGNTPNGTIPELARRNPAVPPRLDGLYRKALSPDPGSRFSSPRELVQEFSAVLNSATPIPRPHGERVPTPKPIAAAQAPVDQPASASAAAAGATPHASGPAQSAAAAGATPHAPGPAQSATPGHPASSSPATGSMQSGAPAPPASTGHSPVLAPTASSSIAHSSGPHLPAATRSASLPHAAQPSSADRSLSSADERESTQPMSPTELAHPAALPGVSSRVTGPPESPPLERPAGRRWWGQNARSMLILALLCLSGLIVGSAAAYWIMAVP